MNAITPWVTLLLLVSNAEAKGAGGDPSPHFERLIDVDYTFFMTRAKMPWGVDPFLKEPGYSVVPAVSDKFELTGIFYSNDQPKAIVNGKSVGTGDAVGDRKVEEIGENYVILKKQASEIELNLPPIREPASDDDSDEDGEGEP